MVLRERLSELPSSDDLLRAAKTLLQLAALAPQPPASASSAERLDDQLLRDRLHLAADVLSAAAQSQLDGRAS